MAGLSEQLRAQNQDAWRAATEHRFVRELADDNIEEAVFRRYLIEDFVFIENLVTLLGQAVAKAPTMPQKRRLAGFLAAVTGDETNYFERALSALGAADAFTLPPAPGPVIEALQHELAEAGDGSYADILSVLVPAEWIYLTWAKAAVASGNRPDRFYLAEWIDLHAIPEFEAFVDWIRAELDSQENILSAEARATIAARFARVVALESAFFDAAYV